jgi:hypothetical protein
MAKGLKSVGRGEFLRQVFEYLHDGDGYRIAALPKDGAPLVHYTDLNALIGIVSRGQLWLWLGPSLTADENEKSVELMLKENKFTEFVIEKSKIAYRR